jgi:hypothetical protein
MKQKQLVFYTLHVGVVMAGILLLLGCTKGPAKKSDKQVKPIVANQTLWLLKPGELEVGSFRSGAPPPSRFRIFTVDTTLLANYLRKAPLESVVPLEQSNAMLPLPFGETDTELFRIVNAPVMAPELAALFPEIQTFSGVSANTTTRQLKCEWTPRGFTAQLITPEGTYFLEPILYKTESRYIVFKKQDLPEVPGKRFDESPSR